LGNQVGHGGDRRSVTRLLTVTAARWLAADIGTVRDRELIKYLVDRDDKLTAIETEQRVAALTQEVQQKLEVANEQLIASQRKEEQLLSKIEAPLKGVPMTTFCNDNPELGYTAHKVFDYLIEAGIVKRDPHRDHDGEIEYAVTTEWSTKGLFMVSRAASEAGCRGRGVAETLRETIGIDLPAPRALTPAAAGPVK
jgi:hypothetical protein